MIDSCIPENHETGYSREGRITIFFDANDHVKVSSAKQHVRLYDAGDVEVAGRAWAAKNLAYTLEFLPTEGLGPNEQYTVYLAPGIEREDGTVIDWDEKIEFTTNSNPWVSRCSPEDGYVGVPQDARISLEFDGDVDRDRTQGSFRLRDGSSNDVRGTFIWGYSGNGLKKLTFVPSQPLWHDAKHRVKVTPSPPSGNPDRDAFTAEFTVSSGILATHQPDRNAKRVPVDSEIVVDFREKVWAGSVTTSFALAPKNGQGTVWVVPSPQNGQTLQVRFRPMQALEADRKYVAALGAGVSIVGGGKTTESYAWEFTTAPATAGVACVTAAAVPTPQGAEIMLTLSGEARVNVSVLNLAGRVVRRIATDRVAAAGRSVFVWNGCNDSGTRVPRGTYLISVEARSERGTNHRALAVVRLNCP